MNSKAVPQPIQLTSRTGKRLNAVTSRVRATRPKREPESVKWASTARRLNVEASAAKRDLASTLSRRGKDDAIVELQAYQQELEQDLGLARDRTASQLGKVRLAVEQLQGLLGDGKATASYLATLQALMDQVEQRIVAVRMDHQHEGEMLGKQEAELEAEVAQLTNALADDSAVAASGSTSRKPAGRRGSSKATSSVPVVPRVARLAAASRASAVLARAGGGVAGAGDTVPPAVSAYNEYVIEHGGLCGGWDERDHETFLRARAHHADDTQVMVRAACDMMPGRSADDVRKHDAWYSKLQLLGDAKRKAVEQWKQEKKRVSADILRTSAAKEEESERRAAARRRREAEEQERRKQQVEAWKRAKQASAETMERLRREEAAARAERRAEVERARRAQAKEAIGAFAEARRAARRAEQQRRTQEAAAAARAARPSARDLAALQQRDRAMLMEKQRRRQAAEAAEAARQQRIARAPVAVPEAKRDPDRLTRPTKAWVRRGLDTDREEFRFGAPDVSHRSVPSWRRGVGA